MTQPDDIFLPGDLVSFTHAVLDTDIGIVLASRPDGDLIVFFPNAPRNAPRIWTYNFKSITALCARGDAA